MKSAAAIDGTVTPNEAFEAVAKARPGDPVAETHFRVRTDKVDGVNRHFGALGGIRTPNLLIRSQML